MQSLIASYYMAKHGEQSLGMHASTSIFPTNTKSGINEANKGPVPGDSQKPSIGFINRLYISSPFRAERRQTKCYV